MNDTPPPDIDDQVAAFREELATATALDTSQLSRDVQQLTEAMMNASTNRIASDAIRVVHDAHARDYAHAVIIGGLGAFAVSALIRATSSELDGPQGLLARLVHVSWTIRSLGITVGSLAYFISGEIF